MEELCGNNIATGKMQINSDPSIPIIHTFDSDSSDDNRDVESTHETQHASPDIDINNSMEFFPGFQEMLGTENGTSQTPHAGNPMSPIFNGEESVCNVAESVCKGTEPVCNGTELIHTGFIAEKRKRGDTTHTEPSRSKRNNLENQKVEIAHTFLNQRRSRNETLERLVDNLKKPPKFGVDEKELMDTLDFALDPLQPSFQSDYYEMLTILKNDWVGSMFMKVRDEMLRGYVDYILRRFRTGKTQNPSPDGSVDPPPPLTLVIREISVLSIVRLCIFYGFLRIF